MNLTGIWKVIILLLLIFGCGGVSHEVLHEVSQKGGKSALDGTWTVRALSGPQWFMAINLVDDRKIINGRSGYNVAKGVPWGEFVVTEEDHVVEKIFVLTYVDGMTVDRVWFAGPGVLDKLEGQFFTFGELRGTFTMERVK